MERVINCLLRSRTFYLLDPNNAAVHLEIDGYFCSQVNNLAYDKNLKYFQQNYYWLMIIGELLFACNGLQLSRILVSNENNFCRFKCV